MDKSKSTKIIIAVAFFAAAAVALAYQFGLFGGSKGKVDLSNPKSHIETTTKDGTIYVDIK